MKARVFVTLRKSVLDPQGAAVKQALDHMNIPGVTDVRIGKMIELTLDPAKPAGDKEIKDMCEKLLANTVIEDYRYEIEK
ncbi:MAG: phosphoribosylformylglycinamidine synthase subunit PurS [Candidatus Omnitrophica bacterium]|jgi:phosphoribosylformylglycinamidine synthase PurS subunit|nr:phosphoribosylformylglycinamidine synthase subunit PurS [Candidatus Omnitrophota bacterium]